MSKPIKLIGNNYVPIGERDSKRYREIYGSYPGFKHKQVLVEGVNSRTKRKFKLWCDVGISYLITRLNEVGIRTCFSCQGDGELQPAYICMSAPQGPKQLSNAVLLIEDFYRGKNLEWIATSAGRLSVYIRGGKNEKKKI